MFVPPKKQETPILKQTPDIFDNHPLAFLQLIGQEIARYRSSLPREYRTQEGFAKLLEPYRGDVVNRSLVARIEEGDPGVSAGMYAACMDLMKVLRRIRNQFETDAGITDSPEHAGDEGDQQMLSNIRHFTLGKAIEEARKRSDVQ
ncbi:MAG: hypothetical protein QM500_13535 [Methylococcales bacterium]